MKAYDEVIEFIASREPQAVIGFKPSSEGRQRAWDLIERQKEQMLSPEDAAELQHYLELEHLMRLAKSRARQLLAL
jgi:hypothetical protein